MLWDARSACIAAGPLDGGGRDGGAPKARYAAHRDGEGGGGDPLDRHGLRGTDAALLLTMVTVSEVSRAGNKTGKVS
jgi:hypothetical protein